MYTKGNNYWGYSNEAKPSTPATSTSIFFELDTKDIYEPFEISTGVWKWVMTSKLDGIENPFHTAFGQQVISESENFWARLMRIGRPITKTIHKIQMPGGQIGYPIVLSPHLDCVLYPKKVMLTCNADARILMQILTGVNCADPVYFIANIKRGEQFTMDFDGELYILSYQYGQISLGAEIELANYQLALSAGGTTFTTNSIVLTDGVWNFEADDNIQIANCSIAANNITVRVLGVSADKKTLYFPAGSFTAGQSVNNFVSTKEILLDGGIYGVEVNINE